MTDQTATEISKKAFDTQQQEQILHLRFEEFVRKWAPKDRSAGHFEADLFMLVRVIHADAARPYEASMNAMLRSLPLATFTTKVGDDVA
jgi:hypothetical protein